MAFSGALTLTDLNDFITPAQACIKPVEQTNSKPKEEREPGAASTEIHIDADGAYYEVSADASLNTNTSSLSNAGASAAPSNKLHQAQISLNDCLACSGCITSAESVLITLQSHTEVLSALAANAELAPAAQRIPVVSIAPQSLASLAAALSSSLSSTSTSPTGPQTQITPRQVLRRVQVFCWEVLGFAHVFDTTFAREVALREHVAEFLERRAAASSVSVEGESGTTEAGREGQLPMLASACPGWICYAEKAHAEMLPFIARTKSPQQVMGTLVKTWLGRAWGRTPDAVYHVTVMPCYDKKLEASRKDFYDELYATRDVDCVITTGELELLMKEKGWDLSVPVPGELDASPHSETQAQTQTQEIQLPELLQHPGSSSGSYLHAITSHIQSTSATPLTLSVKMIRNGDYEEHTLAEEGSGRVVFKGAKCYGFRNLQNIVRKVGRERGVRTGAGAAGRLGGAGRVGVGARKTARRGASGTGAAAEEEGGKYEYVEVMACPGGCVNGGGQVKARMEAVVRDEEAYERDWGESGVSVDGGGGGIGASAKWGDKEWTRRVEEAYWSEREIGPVHALDTPPYTPRMGVKELEGGVEELASRVLRELRSGVFRTSYRAVESEVVGLAVKW